MRGVAIRAGPSAGRCYKRGWRKVKRPERDQQKGEEGALQASRIHIHSGLKMKGSQLLAGLLLLLFFIHSSLELPLQDFTSSETQARVWEERKDFPLVKRHSEGTFSNDYSKFLETQRAQDFVQWLMNSKRSGGQVRRHADGTYTSDVSAYLQDQAAKDFITWLKNGQPKPDVIKKRGLQGVQRRHVDGSFTSDVNKVLDSMAAKEYLQWVMSQSSGTSGRQH